MILSCLLSLNLFLLACDDGSECANECVSGATRCSGNWTQECCEVGDCLDWKNVENCALLDGYVCSSGACVYDDPA